MPDYNRKAATYWWLMVVLGALVLARALTTLARLPAVELLQIGVGIGVTLVAGLFPVRIPRSKNSFAAGEIFIFLLLLLHGPAAAAVAAASEGLIGSWRTSKRWTSRLVSPAMGCVAMFIAGSALEAGIGALRSHGWYGAGPLLLAAMSCALIDFALNTLLITAVPYLKRDQWPTLRELFGSFGWVGITFVGSASVASLLFLSFQQSGLGVLIAAAPIIAMMLATLHYFFRQQEADETVRKSRVEAAERETALAARHMQELAVSERRFLSAFTHASIGMALVSFDGHMLKVNTALQALLGLGQGEAPRRRLFSDFVDAADVARLNDDLQRLRLQQTASFALELRLRHRDDSPLWAAVHGSFFTEIDAAAPSLILQVQDITARRQAEAGLHHIAFHDALTGLPNRRRFGELLLQALGRSAGEPQRQFGLMFLDFDRFKLINDSLGHAAGDDFLVAVTRRIQQHLRPNDTVARLGGDEFAILAEDLDCQRYAVTLADRLLEVLRQPFQIAGTEINSSASIGITFSSMGYATPQDMLRDADIAMYKAKAAGKARYALFDAALHTEVSHRVRLEGDLRRALEADQLSVAYQPLFELSTGRVTGFEALARWDHPVQGAISPTTFIPVAEECGLILPLTDFILRSACLQLGEWQRRDAAFHDLIMHVNVSGNDVAQPGLVARATAAILEARLQPQHLTLELTENILMARLEAAMPTLAELRRLGFGLSVDDFGAGYSSLRHLSRLPVTSLKIDRSFVAELQRGSNEAAVVQAIILLGKSLGTAIIAEGIETADQLDQLSRMGCAAGQGFHLAPPLAADAIDRMLDGLVTQFHPPVAKPGVELSELLH